MGKRPCAILGYKAGLGSFAALGSKPYSGLDSSVEAVSGSGSFRGGNRKRRGDLKKSFKV
jgi:hypothetical protein